MTERACVDLMKVALAVVALSGCNPGAGPGNSANDPAYWKAQAKAACYQEITSNNVVTEKHCVAVWADGVLYGAGWVEALRETCRLAMGKAVDGCATEEAVGRCTDITSGGTGSAGEETVYYSPVYTTEKARKACSHVFTEL